MKKQTGLSVSSLHITQIKRKCELDIGQNYNLSKNNDAKVPQCLPEKEMVNRVALEYFNEIYLNQAYFEKIFESPK